MSWLFPRGTRRLPPIWVDDVPESVKEGLGGSLRMKPEKLMKLHIIEVKVLGPEYIVDSYNKLVESYNKLIDRIDELEKEKEEEE